MTGNICMITGANAGIGFETARQIAALGSTVVMVCRDEGRGIEAVAQIQNDTGNDNVHLLTCDLASQASIHEMTARFRQRFHRLHVLINNAAIYTEERSVTIDGIETQFAVNYLGPFLLTNLLRDTLTASVPARIINVSTANHFEVSLDLDDLQSNFAYEPKVVHVRSKLALILFTYELARQLQDAGVTVNTLHPGVIATNLLGQVRKVAPQYRTMDGMGDDVESLAVGARTPVFLATSADVAGVTGRYFDSCKAETSSAETYDPEKARRLWTISESLTGLV